MFGLTMARSYPAFAPLLHDAGARCGRPSELRLSLLLGAVAMLGPLSIDMYLPSFPVLAHALGVSVASVQLTLAAYLAGLTLGQLAYGPRTRRSCW
jgi:MFS family permease